jgi:PPP family 3-phenylpropionic acid transporter
MTSTNVADVRSMRPRPQGGDIRARMGRPVAIGVERPAKARGAVGRRGDGRTLAATDGRGAAGASTADAAVRRMALFYFAYFAGGGMYAPYLVLYLGQHGVAPAAVGRIAALLPAAALIAQPLWGHLADRRQAPVGVLRRLLLASAACIAVVPLLPVPVGTALGLIAFAAVSSPATALADSSTLRFLAQGRGALGTGAYPRVRAYGSLSFALGAIASSLVFADRSLWRAFAAMAAGLAVAAIATPALEPAAAPARPAVGPEPKAAAAAAPAVGAAPEGVVAAVRRLVAIPAYVVAVVSTFLLQVANAAHGTFFPVYLLKVHMPAALVGTPWAAAALVEVPVFAAMPALEARIGRRRLVVLAIVLYAVRFGLFSVIRAPWPVLAVQLMQGFTFTFFTGAMVVLVGELVPAGLKAVGQTLFMAAGFSLAAIVGDVLGGRVVAAYGVFAMYRWGALVALVAAGLFALGGRWSRPAART